LLSLGLAVIFGMLNVINFAHGALYMLGAFVAWLMLTQLGIGYFPALLLAPLVAVLVSLFGAKVMGAAERSQKQVSELAALLGEAIGGLPLVRAFAAEPWLQQRFEEETDLHRRARYRTQRLLALQYPVVGFLEAAGILAVLVMGAARIQSGDLNGQGFSSYVAALLMLIDPISHLTTNFNEFQQGQASLKRLRQIEREAVEQPDRPNAQPLGRVAGELTLEQVSFGYEPEQPVLQQLSLQVKPGQVVALVGPSGAGKSTILRLMAGLLLPSTGAIRIHGTPQTYLRLDQRHAPDVRLVFQNPALLASLTVIVLVALRRLPESVKRLFTNRYIRRTISSS